jgi:hypothetical protein
MGTCRLGQRVVYSAAVATLLCLINIYEVYAVPVMRISLGETV